MRKIILFSAMLLCGFGMAIANPATMDKVAKISKLSERPPKAQIVRVAVVRDSRELLLSIDGSYTIRDGNTGAQLDKGKRLVRSKMRLLDKGILVGMNVYPVKCLIIVPLREATIVINGHEFRGKIRLIRTPDNRMTAINDLNIEDYVKGVLYHEMPHRWPMEALKTQAVATRTYAISSISPKKDYDMTNDIYSQVYGGKKAEHYRTGLAVDRTAGQVLAYKGKLLPAFFHSDCGGMTEDAKEVWDTDLLPLKGVPCSFCSTSPHMHWKVNLRLKEIQDVLNRQGHKMGAIKDIAIVDRNKSDRINNLKFTGRDGQELIIKGKDFRDMMGPNLIKSNNYDITMKGYFADFNGKGWGHGVGMCQWGTYGMSRQQFTYDQILKYYYPHVDIMDYHALQANKPAK